MDKHENYEYLENFISYRAERAMDKFEKNLALLNIIITLAPVLGLLGTVTGMMGSFSKLVERGQDPMAVTAGLAEALITTVFGLVISIIAVCILGYFERRMKSITLSIEEMSNTLLEAVRKKCECPCVLRKRGEVPMIRLKKRKNLSVGIMISPMIDMSFLLLVFFIVSTMNMNEVKTLPVKLPQASQVESRYKEPLPCDGPARWQTFP